MNNHRQHLFKRRRKKNKQLSISCNCLPIKSIHFGIIYQTESMWPIKKNQNPKWFMHKNQVISIVVAVGFFSACSSFRDREMNIFWLWIYIFFVFFSFQPKIIRIHAHSLFAFQSVIFIAYCHCVRWNRKRVASCSFFGFCCSMCIFFLSLLSCFLSLLLARYPFSAFIILRSNEHFVEIIVWLICFVSLFARFFYYHHHFHKSNDNDDDDDGNRKGIREYIVKIACFYRQFISYNACLE